MSKFLLQAGDGSDNPDDLIELPEETIEANSLEEAKIKYCEKHELEIKEFAKRHWDLLSGSYRYMWILEENE
jgi:hypothetical protein